MPYLIAQIVPALDTQATTIEILATRHKLQDPNLSEVRELLEKGGYELADVLGKNPVTDWPLTAVIYTSPNKNGHGRAGSKCYGYACRKAK